MLRLPMLGIQDTAAPGRSRPRTGVDESCGSITFHTDQQHAHSHLDNHPELRGHIIGQADAISLADWAFRGLLAS